MKMVEIRSLSGFCAADPRSEKIIAPGLGSRPSRVDVRCVLAQCHLNRGVLKSLKRSVFCEM